MSDTAPNAASLPEDDPAAKPGKLDTGAGSDPINSAPVEMTKPEAVDPPHPSPVRQASAPKRGGSVLAGMALGAAIAGGAGYGVQYYLTSQPVFDPAPLEARLTAAEAEVEGLRAEMARLSEAASAPATPDNALLDRLAALEARELPDTAPFAARLDQVEANLAALANLPSETGVSPAALAALQAEVAALKSQDTGVPAEIAAAAEAIEARLADAEARAADLSAQTSALALAATRDAAFGQISAALDSGLPYRAALMALQDIEVPPALASQAESGVPTLTALREAFPQAARLALEQALRANTGESWSDRVATFLRNQTGARSLTPREGNDPDAILSRAEAALANADLQTAMTEVAALPPEAKAELANWVTLGQQRLDAQAAFAGLLQSAGK